jgi:four helix bundle protein
MALQTYRDLAVWQKAMDLAVASYEATKPFPREEMFGMTSQIRRAAASIPANLAEGQGRRSTRDFLHFVSVARGSLKEMETHLILSHRVGLLSKQKLDALLQQCEIISRMMTGLRKNLERRL